jgi:uncharacterized protein YqeY
MSIKEQLNSDLKTALLAGDKFLATTLRGLKGVILNVEIEKGVRDSGLPDSEIIQLLAKEAKKRQDSIDMYVQGGAQDKADLELKEKQIIENYLPEQISDSELTQIVDDIISSSPSLNMGQAIGKVKQQVGSTAEGSRIASFVKARINN